MKIEIVQVERGGYNLPKISKVGIGAKHYGCAIQRKSLDKSWWHSTWMGFQTVRRFSMIFTTPIISFLHGQDMSRFSTRKKLNMLQQDSMCLAFLFFLYVSLCFFIAMCFRPSFTCLLRQVLWAGHGLQNFGTRRQVAFAAAGGHSSTHGAELQCAGDSKTGAAWGARRWQAMGCI